MTCVQCGECGGTVLHHMCDICGKVFTAEEESEVHEKCEHILRTTDWSICQAVSHCVVVLGSVLTTHHYLLSAI